MALHSGIVQEKCQNHPDYMESYKIAVIGYTIVVIGYIIAVIDNLYTNTTIVYRIFI
jgi:hypothetical protein